MSGPLANIQRDGKPVDGAGPGNSRSLKHGATSEQKLGPLRDHHAAELVRDYPNLDERRLALLADRLARLDTARAWIDEQGTVVRNARGEPFPIVDRIEKWATSTERRLDAIEAEARAPVPVGDQLREHLEAKQR